MQIIMFDLVTRNKPRGVENEVSRQLFFAHLGKMRCVRAVVTANDKQKVHFDIEQLAQRILALLRRAADRIEEPKILRRKLGSISIDNGLSNPTLHFLG